MLYPLVGLRTFVTSTECSTIGANISYLKKSRLYATKVHRLLSNDSNGIRTHNHLARKQPFSQTGQKIEVRCEYLSVRCIWPYVTVMSRTTFRVNLLSIVLPECQGTTCSKQAPHLKFKWQQQYSNPQPTTRCCHLNFRYDACFEQGVP